MSMSKRHKPMRTFPAATLCALLTLSCLPLPAIAAVTWTGAGGSSWATTSSWLNNIPPGVADTVTFTDTGSTNLPNELTSILDNTRTIGGLTFNNTAGKYHTLDLNAKTLTLTGNLNFNFDQPSTTTTTLRNGVLAIIGPFSTFNVARSAANNANSIADLSGLSAVTTVVQDLTVGYSSGSNAVGTLLLSPNNSITANRVLIGASNNSPETNGTLRLGLSNTFLTNEFTVGKDNSNALVTIATGGSLSLGSSSQRTLFQVSNGNFGANAGYGAKVDLTSASVQGYFTDFIVGQRDGAGAGPASGTFIGGSGGFLNIGVPGNTSNFYVGRSITSSPANGAVNLSTMGSLTATLNSLVVGAALSGSANGLLQLPLNNAINANTIIVASGNANGTLTLGMNNTLATSQFIIGQDYSIGVVSAPAGASLTLGSLAQRTALLIGTQNTSVNNSYSGKLDLTAAGVTAYLSDLIVAQRDGAGGFGTAFGTLNAGNGSYDIGLPGGTSNFYVGRCLTGSTASGIVDFGNATSLTANVNTLSVGHAINGTAIGILTLASTNTITAANFIVGAGANASATLTLGRSNSILTNQAIIGQDYGNGTLVLPAASTVTLGSAAQRTTLVIGSQATSTNNTYSGNVDFTGAAATLYLADLIVGQRGGPGGFGTAMGTFRAGSSGIANIGVPGNTSLFYVGRTTTGSPANGTVDFSGLSSLVANVNVLAVGNAISTNSGTGLLKLATTNTISANTILIGAGTFDSNGTVQLGMVNTIPANQLFIAQDYGTATVTIPAGGTLTLGSLSQRTNLSIATGITSTNNTYVGNFDLTNARLTAYLGNVLIGNKNDLSGGENGTFTVSNNPNNYIDATSITIGGTRSTGTFNFGGGALFAGSIAKGAGTATFSWTGGTLNVGTFGTPSINFNLANSGTGTLAPRNTDGSIATTTIYGTYTQSAAAAMALRIAGNSPGTGNDLVAISGNASLNGRLNLSFLNNYAPSLNQNYLLATYASRTGTFAFVAPPHMPDSVAFVLDYASSTTQLWLRTVAPFSQTWTSNAPSATFSTPSNWDTITAPTTNSTLTISNTTATPRTVTVASSTTVHRISLSATTSTLNLEVPAGILLGIANQLIIGQNSSLTGGGQVLGDIVVTPAGLIAAQTAGSPLILAGTTTSNGTLQSSAGATLAINGPATLAGTLQASGGAFQFNAPNITLTSPLQLSNGSASFTAPNISAATITGTGAVTVAPGASLTSDGIAATTLNVQGSHTLRAGAGNNGTSRVSTLSIAGTPNAWSGKLDLTNNALILQAASSADKSSRLPTLQNQLQSGKAGAAGITSSTAALDPTHFTLALADNADLHYTNFRGQPIDDNSLIIVQATFGDATLDNKVDALDLNLLASHWQQQSNALWSAGDFNTDGKVDALDLNLLASNWQSSLPLIPSFYPLTFELLTSSSPIPEPATLAPLACAALLLFRRRPDHRS